MRATVKIKKGGTGDQNRATYQIFKYLFLPIKNNLSCNDRVSWIGGDLNGYGVIERKASLMATAMNSGHEHLRGRLYRHVLVSCEPCGDKESRLDAERRLRESAPLLAALLGARRWIAVIHRDTPCPHLHLIIANYDEEKGHRLDPKRDFLKELQEMRWTPFLDKGKGFGTGQKGPRGQAIERLRLLRREECPRRRADALETLQEFLAKVKASGRNTDAIVGVLTTSELPSGWDGTKLLTKSGKPRATPSPIASS